MAQVPRDAVQDELELCVSQLEANLCLSPAPKQAEETQDVLKVLHSCETPCARKQEVMTHVFEDDRLKMAEDQKSMEKADVKPGGVEEQQSRGEASAGVLFGKESDHISEAKPEIAVPSDNSFPVLPELSEIDPRGTGTPLEAVAGVSGAEKTNVRGTEEENGTGALSFAASGREPNSAIPAEGCPLAQSVPTSQHRERAADPRVQGHLQAPALQKPDWTQTTGSAPKEDRNQISLKGPQPEAAPGADTEKAAAAEGTAQKKKKKKKQNPSANEKKTQETEINRKAKAEANGCQQKDTSHQNEASQSEDQLWKEVTWCVEQLELGLKTQKPTAKQAEEALRAIRTLRNDKAPLVKKRQLMRTMFGDYRKKMEEERSRELKLMEMAVKSARVVKVKRSVCDKSCRFIRKSRKSQGSTGSPSGSASQPSRGLLQFTAPQEEFRFNFL